MIMDGELQSAVSFDGLTECDNPTEAGLGGMEWGTEVFQPFPHSGIVSNNVLRTHSPDGDLARARRVVGRMWVRSERSCFCSVLNPP